MAYSRAESVNVYNADATIRALQAFDTDASKAVAAGLRKAIRPMVRAAQQMVPDEPISQWAKYGWIDKKSGRDLAWSAAKVRRGIQVLIGGRRQKGRITSNLAGIINRNPAGAIYELAGARTFGNQLDYSLRRGGNGSQPRLILKQDTRANRAQVERDITAAMHAAERELQHHLDRME